MFVSLWLSSTMRPHQSCRLKVLVPSRCVAFAQVLSLESPVWPLDHYVNLALLVDRPLRSWVPWVPATRGCPESLASRRAVQRCCKWPSRRWKKKNHLHERTPARTTPGRKDVQKGSEIRLMKRPHKIGCRQPRRLEPQCRSIQKYLPHVTSK